MVVERPLDGYVMGESEGNEMEDSGEETAGSECLQEVAGSLLNFSCNIMPQTSSAAFPTHLVPIHQVHLPLKGHLANSQILIVLGLLGLSGTTRQPIHEIDAHCCV